MLFYLQRYVYTDSNTEFYGMYLLHFCVPGTREALCRHLSSAWITANAGLVFCLPEDGVLLFGVLLWQCVIYTACGYQSMSGMQIGSFSFNNSYKWILPIDRLGSERFWGCMQTKQKECHDSLTAGSPKGEVLTLFLRGTLLYVLGFVSAGRDRVSASWALLQACGTALCLWSSHIILHVHPEGYLLVSSGFYVPYFENFH